MKLVILKQPWVTDKPYLCAYDGGSGKPQAASERFATEDEARAWCKARIDGVERVAEFELPDAS